MYSVDFHAPTREGVAGTPGAADGAGLSPQAPKQRPVATARRAAKAWPVIEERA